MQDLHELPKLSDSLTYLYAEHCIVEQKQKAIELFDKKGATLIPVAALSVLLLGPGTRITHAAIKTLADNGCSIIWVGEDGTRCYAQGGGETRRAYHLLHQARLASDPGLRLEVCKRMYRMRFAESLDPYLTIQQLRGMEGSRVRVAYAQNFIHTGKQLSFVYDIADLYKVAITIPLAFRIVSKSRERVGPRVREACRQTFKEQKLLRRILPDIQAVLDLPNSVLNAGESVDSDPALPEPLWTPPDEELNTALPPAPDANEDALRIRRQRAKTGLENGWTVRSLASGTWNVITRPNSPGYTIRQVAGQLLCDCPDFAKNGLGACKHTLAVELTLARQE